MEDWFNTKLEQNENDHNVMISDDLFYKEEKCDKKNGPEDSLLVFRNALMQPDSDIHYYDEPFEFDCGELITTNSGFVYDDMDGISITDTSSSECSYQHSGLHSPILNHMNGGETNWSIPDGRKLKKISVQFAGCRDYMNTANSTNNVDDAERRSYSLGNSNSKNAIAARDNRLRKKKYITSLEESVRNLRAENEQLKQQSKKSSTTVNMLQNEVSYLRRVIANQSTLSEVLKNVMKTPGIKLSTSFDTSQRNSQKHNKLAAKDSNHYYLEEYSGGPSTVCAQHDVISSVSELSGKNSKQNAGMKKMQEKIRLKYDKDKETCAAVDVQNVDNPDTSTASTFADVSGGICLHVAGQNVSLEFCSACDRNAHSGLFSDHSYVKV